MKFTKLIFAVGCLVAATVSSPVMANASYPVTHVPSVGLGSQDGPLNCNDGQHDFCACMEDQIKTNCQSNPQIKNKVYCEPSRSTSPADVFNILNRFYKICANNGNEDACIQADICSKDPTQNEYCVKNTEAFFDPAQHNGCGLSF